MADCVLLSPYKDIWNYKFRKYFSSEDNPPDLGVEVSEEISTEESMG
jgi:hypothetical protein